MTGLYPKGPLIQGTNGTLSGTTASSEIGRGSVFKIQPDGTGFTVLKWFTNSVEGTDPIAGLVVEGDTLYGTTPQGGAAGFGTIFRLNTDGSGFGLLRSFSRSDGANPSASLVLSEGVLYGTTSNGGSTGWGTVFKVNKDGAGYAVLKSFGLNDGANPHDSLVLQGSILYGVTEGGGDAGRGILFKLSTDGSGFAILKSFPTLDVDSNGNFFNTDGASPSGGLILSQNTLYGTTSAGGAFGDGTVFSVDTSGSGYKVLRNFNLQTDGAKPQGNLILAGETLYGITRFGGNAGVLGTIFKINTDGSAFAVLWALSFGDCTAPEA